MEKKSYYLSSISSNSGLYCPLGNFAYYELDNTFWSVILFWPKLNVYINNHMKSHQAIIKGAQYPGMFSFGKSGYSN